jgi:tRNA A37 threonylcarbamoyladenosine dehydratase
MKERILDIYPEAEVVTHQKFYLPECAEELIKADYDYIIDAIDTVTAKIDLIEKANKMGIPIISSMGAGNNWIPQNFQVADIYATSVVLCKSDARELRKRGIQTLKVVFSLRNRLN